MSWITPLDYQNTVQHDQNLTQRQVQIQQYARANLLNVCKTGNTNIRVLLIGVVLVMASLGFIAPPPPLNFRSPLDTKAPGLPLIYLVGPLKKFHLLPPNTSV